MTVAELFQTSRVHMSCEIFPPKAFDKVEEAKAVVREICALHPAFVSVTYGATGTTPRFTQEMSECVQGCGVTALNHLTCINSTKSKVRTVLDDLCAAGVQNVLALRGDIPEGMGFPGEDHFHYAAELIAAIKRRGGFCVGAACYPEGHPEAPDRDSDLRHLREKQDAGADFLTTQMFFDNNILYQFLYRALQKGITIPVTAGVMPVVSARQIKRITALSGASLPPRFLAILDRFGGDAASMQKAGIAYATEQLIDLIANGVNHIHLYTMNRPDIARAIFDNLGCILDTSYGK
ncbi:MAG: methylenetetrahydrofolate reductase [Clostridia bacterium]